METTLSPNIKRCVSSIESALSSIQSSTIITQPEYITYQQTWDNLDHGEVEIDTQDEEFNTQWIARTREFIFDNSFITIIHKYIEEIVAQDPEDTTIVDIEQFKCSSHLKQSLDKISTVLDLTISLISHDPLFKKVFYKLLSVVTTTIFEISTKHLAIFWLFLESRIDTIKAKAFDGSMGDRISILHFTNSLIDRHFNQYHGAKDPVHKDTFNDTIQTRIRIFTNKMLKVSDDTGLNRHYLLSDKKSPKILPRKAKRFVSDILLIFALMKDPYTLVKNESKLKQFSRVASDLFDELMNQEIHYLKKNPSDKFKIPDTLPENERLYLVKKYTTKFYFPEVYFQSQFNNIEKQKIEDQDALYDLFDNAVFREQVIFQIYFTCDFLFEFTNSNKKALLKTLPANSKHFIESSTSDFMAKTFYRIKKETLNGFRSSDSHLSFLLSNLSLSEKNWWFWLLNGKNSKVLVDKSVTEEELVKNNEKFEGLFPEKTTKYFNIYATPQLSKRMRGKRGLDEITLIERDVEMGDEDEVKKWRLKRSKRSNWLEVGE
ncbi:hypothetical protein CLIB1444_04S09560 [[Candida] jaroonii]|uniref:Uncharacterized protein n=1 Tax=[Candida] jaroonii TaxID=467808 RepID=A0ACA9Y759_9ASCO|nr:hypothetical protein CLIB1444_04S09560 [[Candida] jaroonii]